MSVKSFCKGTLEALMQCDMVLIFHVPLFSSWLKKVMDNGVRIQMIIDAPDDLYALQSPPGLKEALLHAHKLYENTKQVRVTSKAGTDFTYERGEYPVMSQYGFADEPGHIVSIEGGLDATLMREWLEDGKDFPEDRDPFAISHLGWGLNPQARWDSIALYGDSPERNRAATRAFPGNFLFSTGPNTQGGGTRKTRGHYDLPMRGCTIELDGNRIIEDGKVLDPKMIVPRERR